MKLFKVLDIAAEKNININETVVSNAVTRHNQDLKRAEKKKRDKSGNVQMPKKSLGSYLDLSSSTRYLNWEIINEPYIFGKTVLLLVQGLDGSLNYVVVNTEDKKSFLSCSILIYPTNLVSAKQFRNNYTEEEYFTTQSSENIYVWNKNGEKVLAVPISGIARIAKDGSPPVVMYPKVFGIHQERNSIWCVILGLEDEDDVISDIEDKICWTIGSVYEELSDNSDDGPYVKELTYIGKNDIGKLLMANLNSGLAFINPNTMEYVPIKIKDGCAEHFEFTKEHNAMKGDFEDLEILTEKVFTVDDVPVYRVALGVQNKVFVLEIDNHHEDSTVNLEMLCCIVLPGLPKEVCLVGKQVGMLISFTQHSDKDDEYYREHVFYFDFDGHLHGVLLCLGHGPRSFCPVYLHGNTDNEGQAEGTSKGGWHVYLRDGRDGIMCIRLH